VLDSGVVSDVVEEDKTGSKRGTTAVIPSFVMHLVGLPLPGSPLLFFPAGEGRGVVWLDFCSSEWIGAMRVVVEERMKPTSTV